jgi:hypothetical protein
MKTTIGINISTTAIVEVLAEDCGLSVFDPRLLNVAHHFKKMLMAEGENPRRISLKKLLDCLGNQIWLNFGLRTESVINSLLQYQYNHITRIEPVILPTKSRPVYVELPNLDIAV